MLLITFGEHLLSNPCSNCCKIRSEVNLENFKQGIKWPWKLRLSPDPRTLGLHLGIHTGWNTGAEGSGCPGSSHQWGWPYVRIQTGVNGRHA